jgi:hypothetical protein
MDYINFDVDIIHAHHTVGSQKPLTPSQAVCNTLPIALPVLSPLWLSQTQRLGVELSTVLDPNRGPGYSERIDLGMTMVSNRLTWLTLWEAVSSGHLPSLREVVVFLDPFESETMDFDDFTESFTSAFPEQEVIRFVKDDLEKAQNHPWKKSCRENIKLVFMRRKDWRKGQEERVWESRTYWQRVLGDEEIRDEFLWHFEGKPKNRSIWYGSHEELREEPQGDFHNFRVDFEELLSNKV